MPNLSDIAGKHGKKVILHTLFWVFYVLFFGSVYGKYGNDFSWYILESLCMLPFVMFATYVTIYAILPFYLKSRRLIVTIVLIILLLFTVTLGERIFLRKLNALPVTADSVFGVTFLYLMLETNFMVAIAFAIKIVKKWLQQQQEKHEIEKRNLRAELDVLKSQLHPHFLFNTMNNLYALSLEHSAKTSEGIARISELLRSVLYECNEPEVPLQNEIDLIKNFINLENMRYEKPLNLEFTVTGETENERIAPMIIFTFVENCFKHGSRINPDECKITLDLWVNKDGLTFTAENTLFPVSDPNSGKKEGGIGLLNLNKRLDIIYRNRYLLNTEEDSGVFRVKLFIKKIND